MGRRAVVKHQCCAMVSRSGDWARCAERGQVGSAGWTSTRFGFFCPQHASMLRSVRGRGA